MGNSDTPSTRDRILPLLRLQGPLTAQELAPELGICVSAVRQHAALLERDGLIVSRQRKSRVGRPGKEYALTDASEDEFPKVYKQVALQILVGSYVLTHSARRLVSYCPQPSLKTTQATIEG